MHVGTGISAQQGMISISETKRKSHGQGQGFTGGGGGGEGGKTVTFSFSKRRNCCGCMGVGIVMKKTDMLKTSGRTSFPIFSVSSV